MSSTCTSRDICPQIHCLFGRWGLFAFFYGRWSTVQIADNMVLCPSCDLSSIISCAVPINFVRRKKPIVSLRGLGVFIISKISTKLSSLGATVSYLLYLGIWVSGKTGTTIHNNCLLFSTLIKEGFWSSQHLHWNRRKIILPL